MIKPHQGTGPWNLDVQVIGPHSSDNLHISNIESSRKSLQIPIPSAIMENGGQFEVALGKTNM
jgi:nucleoporin POM152